MSDSWIGLLGLAGTLLLVGVGLLNYSVFRRQLEIARQQIDAAMRQLALQQRQPDMHLIQRAITETSDHARLLLDRPYLRPYFYENRELREGDRATADEIKAMAEVILNNFASSLMHSAAFAEYPLRGVDRTIAFHMRQSPAMRDYLMESFERFPFSGLSLLVLKNDSADGVERDLARLIDAEDVDERERGLRKALLELYRGAPGREAVEFTALSMSERR